MMTGNGCARCLGCGFIPTSNPLENLPCPRCASTPPPSGEERAIRKIESLMRERDNEELRANRAETELAALRAELAEVKKERDIKAAHCEEWERKANERLKMAQVLACAIEREGVTLTESERLVLNMVLS